MNAVTNYIGEVVGMHIEQLLELLTVVSMVPVYENIETKLHQVVCLHKRSMNRKLFL